MLEPPAWARKLVSKFKNRDGRREEFRRVRKMFEGKISKFLKVNYTKIYIKDIYSFITNYITTGREGRGQW